VINNKIFFSLWLSQQKKFRCFDKADHAYLYFKNHKINLITGEKILSSIDELFLEFKKISIDQSFENPRLFFLFYELGHLFNNTNICVDEALAIDIKFLHSFEVDNFTESEKVKIFKRNILDVDEYGQKFEQVKKHLKCGDAYQINLTAKERRKFSSSELELVYSATKDKDKISPYFHFLNIPYLKTLYLSNSPECLFQRKKTSKGLELYTMPIKGSAAISSSADQSWQKLLKSKKDQAELNIITDLMRNDLSRIDLPTSRVLMKRGRLDVPKIVHQYSLVANTFAPSTNLLSIVSALFPGGSITGAPKRKVMQLIEAIEDERRGAYCGSTIILDKSMMAASINIRTAAFNFTKKEVNYGTGGGITIKSQKYDEYNEILQKSASFFSIFDDNISVT
jgi:para-aminobenzoate synthetase component I